MRRFALPGLVVGAAVGVLLVFVLVLDGTPDASSIDAKVARRHSPAMPQTSLQALGSSRRETLASFRGKVVVLNLFASWCDDCAAEASMLVHEQRSLVTHDASIVGVAFDDVSRSTIGFDRRYGVDYPVLQDANGRFARALGAYGVPETFVIDRQGRIEAVRREPLTQGWLDQHLRPVLARGST